MALSDPSPLTAQLRWPWTPLRFLSSQTIWKGSTELTLNINDHNKALVPPLKVHRLPKWVSGHQCLSKCPLPPLSMSPRPLIRHFCSSGRAVFVGMNVSFCGIFNQNVFPPWPRKTPAPAKSLRLSPRTSEQSHRGNTPSTSSSPERRWERLPTFPPPGSLGPPRILVYSGLIISPVISITLSW